MTNYSRGAIFERKVKKAFEDEGWVVIRSAGSHGQFDLVCISAYGSIMLLQCKTRKPTRKEILEFCKATNFFIRTEFKALSTLIVYPKCDFFKAMGWTL